MASISPNITVNSTPGLEITTSTPGMSYEAFINMLGAIVYKIQEMYYGNSILSQLNNPIGYDVFTNQGDTASQVISTPVSPNQYQPTQYVKLKARGVIINSQCAFNFLMLAGNSIQFIFYAERIQVMDVIDHAGYTNNFETVARSLGKPDYFDDQKEVAPPVIEFVPDEEHQAQGFVIQPYIQEIRKQSFILNIRNTTSASIPVSLFNQGNPADTIANAHTRYQWNLTGVSFSNPTFSLPVWPVGTANVGTLSGSASNAQALVLALNQLNGGIFWLETAGPNTYLVTWNDNVVYGDLNIGVVQSVISWSNTSGDSSMQVNANAVSIINSAAPPQSGTVNVNNGDVIDGSYIFGVAPPFSTILIRRTLKLPPFTVNTVYTDVGTSVGGLIPSFIINTAYNYSISLTTP